MKHLKRYAAASAVAILTLTAAACSDETDGEASPADTTTATTTTEDDGDDSTSAAPTTSDDESDTTSESDTPAGSEEASDGSFTYEMPAGYEDGADILNNPGGIAVIYDPASDSTFPTNMIATTTADMGLSLQDAADQVREEIESKFSTTTEEGNPSSPTSIDGEEFVSWTTEPYNDAGQDVASAQVITQHDGNFYFFTVNTLPGSEGAAGAALLEWVSSVQWAD